MPKSRIVIKKPTIVFKDLSADGVVGWAYKDDDHLAEIHVNQSDREIFLTSFHECFHLTLPDLKETPIIKLENTVGVALWKVVLRLKKKWLKEGK